MFSQQSEVRAVVDEVELDFETRQEVNPFLATNSTRIEGGERGQKMERRETEGTVGRENNREALHFFLSLSMAVRCLKPFIRSRYFPGEEIL